MSLIVQSCLPQPFTNPIRKIVRTPQTQRKPVHHKRVKCFKYEMDFGKIIAAFHTMQGICVPVYFHRHFRIIAHLYPHNKKICTNGTTGTTPIPSQPAFKQWYVVPVMPLIIQTFTLMIQRHYRICQRLKYHYH